MSLRRRHDPHSLRRCLVDIVGLGCRCLVGALRAQQTYFTFYNTHDSMDRNPNIVLVQTEPHPTKNNMLVLFPCFNSLLFLLIFLMYKHLILNAIYYYSLIYFFFSDIYFSHYVHGLLFNFIILLYLLLGTLNI